MPQLSSPSNPTSSSTNVNPSYKWIGLLAGLVLVLGLFALSLTGATANPPSAAQVQMQTWVNTLKTDKLTAERHEAQTQLEAAGESAVPSLVTALHSSDPVLRQNAAEMLGYIASPNASAGLSVLLNDRVVDVRRTAAWALGEIKDTTYVPDLERTAASDRSEMVRQTALDSLSRISAYLGLVGHYTDQGVRAIAVAPNQPNVVYLAARRKINDVWLVRRHRDCPHALVGIVTDQSEIGGNARERIQRRLPDHLAAVRGSRAFKVGHVGRILDFAQRPRRGAPHIDHPVVQQHAQACTRIWRSNIAEHLGGVLAQHRIGRM